jgi:hypothetical protein
MLFKCYEAITAQGTQADAATCGTASFGVIFSIPILRVPTQLRRHSMWIVDFSARDSVRFWRTLPRSGTQRRSRSSTFQFC